MRIRPGRTRSLISGVLALVVMIAGLALMPRNDILGGHNPMSGAFTSFRIIWIAFGVIGAGAAFYNAFSQKGIPLYDVETEDAGNIEHRSSSLYCPQCGKPVGKQDKFCRSCGSAL